MGKKPNGELVMEVTEQERLSAPSKSEVTILPEREEEAKMLRSALIATIGRRIRTPIDNIIEMTELALGTNLTAQQRESLEAIKMSANSLADPVNDIFDLCKIEAGQLELEEIDFDLRNTLDNAAEILEWKAKEAGVGLACHVEPNVPGDLIGDPGRLRQVIVNLTETALNSTKEDGVTIRVKMQDEGDSSIALHCMITYSGPGLTSDTVGTVFKASIHPDAYITQGYGGTEWGIAISQQLVKMMGGRLWVESEEGTRSTIHFTTRFGLSDVRAGGMVQLERADLSGVPVLIVDDNEINRLVFHEMVSSWGLVPTDAGDGNEALCKVKNAFESGGSYGLILMDLEMPGVDGFEVARKIKEGPYGKGVKIILLTSAGQKGDAAYCKEVGISGYLVKPAVRPSDLLDAISLALGHPPPGEKMPLITRYTIQEARRRLNALHTTAA